jgi:predicted transcriptional regulator
LATEPTTVGDVMSRDLLTLEQETTLVDAAAAMTGREVGAVLVVSGERLTGILTERDVLRAVASGDVTGCVADWMTRGPETVDADESTQQAGVVMIHGGFRHLPVLNAGVLVGIVSIRDLMRVALDDVSPRGV